LGRWLQPDPVGFADGINLYAYVGNSPMGLVDPSGLMAEQVAAGASEAWSVVSNHSSYIASDIHRMVGDIFTDPAKFVKSAAPSLGALAPVAGKLPVAISQGIGIVRGLASFETPNSTPASSVYDTSITSPGSQYPNVRTNVGAQEFQSNLMSNGYKVVKQANGSNGPVTVLNNGRSTWTIYERSSTGAPGAQFFGDNGSIVKYSLGGP
jgi:hypothetical protein